jgi:RNA polymerase sigma-70 factor (ECF subfamily)
VEFSELSEETLYMRALQPPKSLEDLAMDNLHDERLQDAIANLSETQRRRFVLYYEFGLTYEDIAEIDGCKWQSVQNSVGRARKKVIEN